MNPKINVMKKLSCQDPIFRCRDIHSANVLLCSKAMKAKTRVKTLRPIMASPGVNTMELAEVTGLTRKGVE